MENDVVALGPSCLFFSLRKIKQRFGRTMGKDACLDCKYVGSEHDMRVVSLSTVTINLLELASQLWPRM